MIWLVIRAFPLLILNILMLGLATWGTAVNGWMLGLTIRRTLMVRRSGEADRDEVARLEMKRAVRCELVYFLIQGALLPISIYQFFKVVPILPTAAVDFFFVSMAARASISLLLAYLSVNDLIDRRRIGRELDRLHPETPPSLVG